MTDATLDGGEGRGDSAGEALRDACRTFARALGGRSRAWVVAASGVADVARELGLDAGSVATPLGGVPLAMADVRVLARRRDARPADERTPLVLDVSLTSALGCPAGRLGADVALASLDRVVRRRDCGMVMVGLRREALQGRNGCEGLADAVAALPAPDDALVCELAHGMADYDQRRRTANDNAQVAAAFLRCHPAVAEVRYPGLTDDPSYEAGAANLEDGFGPLVDAKFAQGVGRDLARDWHAELCGSYVPGGTASSARVLQDDSGALWLRVECGCGDPKELVVALEALLGSMGKRV
ncbi:MAG: PLP-dependent transferase [Olsenella sp.]|nr:PLP-dependent transferase [Olsenella sp.]MCI1289966.1 PLP-dependent transferase [Olsenella sp.]